MTTATKERTEPVQAEQSIEQADEETDEQPYDGPSVAEAELDRSQPINVGPDRGGNLVLQAWDGLYWIFNARVERFDVTDEGIVAVGLTFPQRFHIRTILRDLQTAAAQKRARLDMIPQYFWLSEAPEQITDPAEASAWVMQYLRVKDDEGSFTTPDYAKKAVAEYKKRANIALPRGRRGRKGLQFDMESLNIDALIGVDPNQLAALRSRIEDAMAKQKEPEAELLPA